MAPGTSTVILPIRDFSGMSRLEPVLDVSRRMSLIRALCELAVTAARQARMPILTVTSADEVLSWSREIGIAVIDDPGQGLSAAAESAVAALKGAPWLVVHPDLPLIDAPALKLVSELAFDGPVIVPSQDGGTNVLGSSGPFPFAYGQASFHRHLAAAPQAKVVALPELSIEIDTPAHLAAIDAAALRPSLLV